ncbi:FAD/NAD(P)-binding domain-containing protein [Xylariaceae sp. FL0255]|nr:FAD/NAD(P)-binding domain-containing protein [Xylariaceae sp. FL0255]
MASTQAPPPIAIIGGGPGGLTLARLLEVQGIDYVLYERDANVRASRGWRGSLLLHPEGGQRIMSVAGLVDQFEKHARYEERHVRITRPSGICELRLGEDDDPITKEPPKTPEIDHGTLRQILVDSIPRHKILWGHALKSVERDADGKPVLNFTNGRSVTGFKLVVGADGVRSKVRPLLTPTKLVYADKVWIEARITPKHRWWDYWNRILGPGTIMTLGTWRSIQISRQVDGTYQVYFQLMIPEDYYHHKFVNKDGTAQDPLDCNNPERMRRYLLDFNLFGDWARDWHELILGLVDFRAWPLYGLPRLYVQDWKSVSGVTALGDAAHASYPSERSVDIAMRDAMELVDKLHEYGTVADGKIDEAVRAYEAVMLPRGAEHIKICRRWCNEMVQEWNPDAFLHYVKDIFFQAGQPIEEKFWLNTQIE